MNKIMPIVGLATLLLASCGGQKASSTAKTSTMNTGAAVSVSSTYVAPKTKTDVINFLKTSGTASGDTYTYNIVTIDGKNKATRQFWYNTTKTQFGVRLIYFYQTTSSHTRTWQLGGAFQWGSITSTTMEDGSLTDSSDVMTAATDFYFHDCTFFSDGSLNAWQAQIPSNVWSYSQSELQTIAETLVYYYSDALITVNKELSKRSLPSLQ
jgi:hypothetical protein